jgi:predicted ATP-dependent serine protease
MSQTVQLAKPLSSQMLFPLSMRNIDELFPGFAAGDFAVVYGSPSIQYLTSLLCVKAQLPTQLGGLASSVVFVDGGNTFSLYQVARLAQIHQMDPKQTLDRIYLSRAFTAYQMTALIMEQLQEAVEKFRAKLVIISDLAGLFIDKDIADEEARQVFSQVMAYLSGFARRNQIVLIATYHPRASSSRNLYLQTLACGTANVVIALRQTKYDREFALEKHPRFTLGTAEFPSEDMNLTQFM